VGCEKVESNVEQLSVEHPPLCLGVLLPMIPEHPNNEADGWPAIQKVFEVFLQEFPMIEHGGLAAGGAGLGDQVPNGGPGDLKTAAAF